VRRLTLTRVIPPPIELVNWDEIDGKAPRKAADGDGASA